MVYTVLNYPFCIRSLSPTWYLLSPLSPIYHLLPYALLFLLPIPISVLCALLPSAWRDQSLLVPPPIGNPWCRPPFHLKAEFQNSSHHNVFCNCIMAPMYVGLHLFQHDRLHISLQWGVIPGPVLPFPGLFYQDPALHIVVETTNHPPDASGHETSICNKDQDILQYGKVKDPWLPSVCDLPP